ncbi:MAG: hypothetical protein Q9181_001446 [Wetmoreana brouardii]
MVSLLCAIITTITAAIFGMIAIHQTGLVPVEKCHFFTNNPVPTHFNLRPIHLNDEIFLQNNHRSINGSTNIPTSAPLGLIQPTEDTQPIQIQQSRPPVAMPVTFSAFETKASSSTTTTPPPVKTVIWPSFSDYLQWYLLRLVLALVTTIASVSLHLSDIVMANPPVAPRPVVVVKKRTQQQANAVLTEAEVAALYRLRCRQGSGRTAGHKKPAVQIRPKIPAHVLRMTAGDLLRMSGAESPLSEPIGVGSSPATPPSVAGAAASPPTPSNSLNNPPTAGSSSPSSPPASPSVAGGSAVGSGAKALRAQAPVFVPRALAGPSTLTPEQFKEKYPQHGEPSK